MFFNPQSYVLEKSFGHEIYIPRPLSTLVYISPTSILAIANTNCFEFETLNPFGM